MPLNFQSTKVKVLLHAAAWAAVLGLPIYNSYHWDVPREFIWGFYAVTMINGIIFYANYLILIPRFFFHNNRLKFFIFNILLSGGIFITAFFSYKALTEARGTHDGRNHVNEQQLDRNEPQREPHRMTRSPFGPIGIYNFVFNTIVFTVFAIGLRVIERHTEVEKRQKELEKEKLNSELAFLKNQISPHFFFNTLNNIYSLIGINTQDSQEAVLKLSRLMRYLLYESEQGEIKLGHEIEFMNNYIDLMRLRLSEKVKLDVSFPASYDDMAIPPLLFISIIENAFKHGISYREKSFITVTMEVSKEMITFSCVNSLIAKPDRVKEKSAGIGLENLKKRLVLLFPNRHELKIEDKNDVFEVLVRIFLTKS
jgi:hypothetical protein